jgi:hypothetical protein
LATVQSEIPHFETEEEANDWVSDESARFDDPSMVREQLETEQKALEFMVMYGFADTFPGAARAKQKLIETLEAKLA